MAAAAASRAMRKRVYILMSCYQGLHKVLPVLEAGLMLDQVKKEGRE
jgi:hypothetical protein